MITRTDVVLALSNSGETPEVVFLLPHLKRLGVPLIVMTGGLTSTLAKAASVVLDVSVPKEACPLQPRAARPAPRQRSAMGDALAVALLDARGFTDQDFARRHPSGSLARQLQHVDEFMRTGDAVPRVHENTPLRDGLKKCRAKVSG